MVFVKVVENKHLKFQIDFVSQTFTFYKRKTRKHRKREGILNLFS